MSLASSLKWVLAAAGALVAGLGAAVALVPFLLPTEAVRRDVAAELTRRTGVAATIVGPVTVTVLPQLSVRLEGVRLAEPGAAEPQATAAAVIGSLRLLPLLAGRLSISEYVLVEPRIAVTVARDGASNWDLAFRRLRANAGQLPGGMPDIRIVDGQALVTEEKTQGRVVLEAIGLALSWPGPSRQANLSGSFTANGQAVEINAVVARPLALFTAEPTGLKMRVSSVPVRSAFEGTVTNGDALTAAGTMTLETASLRQLLRWIGQNPGVGPSFGAFTLKGDVQLQPNSLAFTKVNTELDGNVAEGALTISFEGARPQVQGTLDAGRVVATPYFRDLSLTADDRQGWNRRPIDLSAIAATDLDVRLSASEVVVGQARLGRTAAAVVARGGRLNVTLGEAQAYGGTLSGALIVAPRGEDMDVRAALNVQRAQLGLGLGEWFGFRRLDGTANIQLAIEARGASMADLARTAAGQMTLTAIEGAVHGFNAEAILRRLERRPLSAAGVEARSGRTPYDRVAATIRVAGGVATTTDLVLDGQVVRVNVEGVARLPTREFEMRGIAALKRRPAAAGTPEPNFELPFLVQGPWDDPFILPDPQSLIRRSGAAAPLRDLTRDRDALRAVLDAISRHALPEPETLPPPTSSYNPFATIRPRN